MEYRGGLCGWEDPERHSNSNNADRQLLEVVAMTSTQRGHPLPEQVDTSTNSSAHCKRTSLRPPSCGLFPTVIFSKAAAKAVNLQNNVWVLGRRSKRWRRRDTGE